MEKISVIIPAYNSAHYLDKCIESLLRQTYTEWEAILIDDGSSDGITPTLCDNLGKRDSRIKVFHQVPNKGLSTARNTGLKLANGSLITFLDSDDFFEFNHLESLYNAIQQANASIAISGFRRCNSKGKLILKYKLLPPGIILQNPLAFALTLMEKKISNHIPNKLFRKELWKGIQFPDGHNYEDYTVILDVVARAERITHTGIATYNRVITKGSISHTPSLKNQLDYCIAAQKRIEQLRTYPHLSNKEKLALSVFPIKKMVSRYNRILHLPDSPEKDKTTHYLEQQFVKLNIPIYRKTISFQIISYFLQMRKIQKFFCRKVK